jgi:hypothetical protein
VSLEKLKAELAGEVNVALLDVVDHLLDKGCVITGSAVFALAEVDLVYLELRVLACAAERMLGSERLR